MIRFVPVFTRFLVLLVLLLIDHVSLNAQDHLYNKVWILGGHCGVDFSTGKPVPISAKMETIEGVASATGPDGKLLFYTDGTTIWNSKHEIMPNGNQLNPYTCYSTTQAAVIVPMPDSAKYYVFSLTNVGVFGGLPSGGYLYYSVVNMDLDNYSGDIEPGRKSVLLDNSSLSEKMTAVRGDNCNIWVVVHNRSEPIFKSYEVTNAGINQVPVISVSGIAPDPLYSPASFFYQGTMKFSPDRTKLALGNAAGGKNVELHKFNPATGSISDGTLLSDGSCYGVCFSPDNSKLYATVDNVTGLSQFDVSLTDPAAIRNSQVVLPGTPGREMQLGPDNKIYFATGGSPYGWPVIEYPDKKGKDIELIFNSRFTHYGQGPIYGLPNAFPVLQPRDTVSTNKVITGCFSDEVTLTIDNGRDHLWENNTTRRTRIVKGPGVYIVRYIGADCIYHIDSFTIPQIPHLSYPLNCSKTEDKAWLNPQQGDDALYNYTWYNSRNEVIQFHTSSKGDTLFNIQSGDYKVKLSVRSGCDTMLSFRVSKASQVMVSADKDTICSGESISFHADYTELIKSYSWQLGDGDISTLPAPSKKYLKAGEYTISHNVITIDGCESGPAMKDIKVYKTPEVYAGEDVSILAGDSLVLKGTVTGSFLRSRWSPAVYLSYDTILQPWAAPATTQLYQLEVEGESGCISHDHVTITVLSKIQVPNVFSPNNDGINDKWEIPGLSNYTNVKVSVFNRWGQVVYRSVGYSVSWDGRQMGKELPVGTYYYIIDFRTGLAKMRQGSVSIIR